MIEAGAKKDLPPDGNARTRAAWENLDAAFSLICGTALLLQLHCRCFFFPLNILFCVQYRTLDIVFGECDFVAMCNAHEGAFQFAIINGTVQVPIDVVFFGFNVRLRLCLFRMHAHAQTDVHCQMYFVLIYTQNKHKGINFTIPFWAGSIELDPGTLCLSHFCVLDLVEIRMRVLRITFDLCHSKFSV